MATSTGGAGDGPDAGAKLAVEITNGGSIPIYPGAFFLGNPTTFNGTETEGGAYTAVVDTTTTIPVLVLGHVPSVGDILIASATGGRWVAERGAPPQEIECCGAWACYAAAPPETWTVTDSYFKKTVVLNRVQCLGPCADGTGGGYCLWSGSTTVNFQGSDACPAINDVPITYHIGCYSAAGGQGAGIPSLFWVSCGTNGDTIVCDGGAQGTGLCPGLDPLPGNFPFSEASLGAVYPCVQAPNTAAVSSQAQYSFFGASIEWGPPYALYGMTCDSPIDIPFTLAPSTSSQICGEACSPCVIPYQDLAISWVNPLTGNGSDTLAFDPATMTWSTGCSGGGTNPLQFKLLCTSGQIELRVYYFTSGQCPGGQSSDCTNLAAGTRMLDLVSVTCGAGFMLVFTLTNTSCPALAALGYTGFTVSM